MTKTAVRNRLTINDAIVAVMKDAGVPLTGKEAYDRIVAQGLYEFHARQPAGVVVSQIRSHCKDLDSPSAALTKYFGMTKDGKFYPLDATIIAKAAGHGKRPQTAEKLTLAVFA